MGIRTLALLGLVILPGIGMSGISAYYLFPDWAELDVSATRYRQLAATPSASVRDLAIVQAAENRHRINCFAEGMGVMVGWTIAAIGIHGLCSLPRST